MIVKISSEKIREFIEKQFAIDGMVSMEDFEIWLAEQPKVGEWIPCSERLPEDDRTKLVTFDGITEAGYYSNGDWWCVGDNINLSIRPDVIAWMPLPEPYKEDEDGDS